MSEELKIMLIVCAALIGLFCVFMFIRTLCVNSAKSKKNLSEPAEDLAAGQTEKEETPVVKSEETVEKTETETYETLSIGDAEVETAEKPAPEKAPSSFAGKLLKEDVAVLDYYDAINNKLLSYKKVHARFSFKALSYRFGKELIAKITLKDGALRMNFALSIDDEILKGKTFEDDGAVKSLADVPVGVGLNTVDELRNALAIADELVKKFGLESKPRFLEIDSIAELKATVEAENAE